MDARRELADFLQSRRARLSPEDAGLRPFGDRRRVQGLRREELAQVAGLSVPYLTRLEQGHAGAVSSQVLDALSDALALDEDERIHLHTLAGALRDPRWNTEPEDPRPTLLQLLQQLTGTPAMLLGRCADVLAWNDLAHRLYAPDLPAEAPASANARPNTSRRCFLHEPTRALYEDWPTVARDNVAFLRLSAVRYPDDHRLAELIGELTMQSPDFADLWASHPVGDAGHATRVFLHPQAGRMELTEEVVALPDDPGLRMIFVSAQPDSSSAWSLRSLDPA